MEEATTDLYKLQALGCDEKSTIASPSKFRSIITIDSEPYKVGSDWSTTKEALDALMVVYGESCTCQIYDDQGIPQLDANCHLI